MTRVLWEAKRGRVGYWPRPVSLWTSVLLEPRDAWVGLYWHKPDVAWKHALDIYICPVPFVAIKLMPRSNGPRVFLRELLRCIAERRGFDVEFDPDWVVHPGATLREWREESRPSLSIVEAARRCHMSERTYVAVEAGEREITTGVAERIASGTGTSRDFWLNHERNFREGLAAGKAWDRNG